MIFYLLFCFFADFPAVVNRLYSDEGEYLVLFKAIDYEKSHYKSLKFDRQFSKPTTLNLVEYFF